MSTWQASMVRRGAVRRAGAGEDPAVSDREATQPGHRRDLSVDRAFDRVVNHFYFYAVDADFGPFFLKFCSYFPYNAKLCINGNEWAKRQAAKAGVGFTALDNGCPSCATRPGCRRSATGWARPRSMRCCASDWPGCRTRSPGRTGSPATATTSRCCRSSSASIKCSMRRCRAGCCSRR